MCLTTRSIFLLPVILTFAGFNCGSKNVNPVHSAAALEITTMSLEIFSGGKLQLNAIVTLSDGSKQDVTGNTVWSNKPSIAGQVDEPGEFIAFFGQTGNETVHAEYSSQIAAIEINVVPRAVSLSVTPTRMNLLPGENIQFNAAAIFEGGRQEFVEDKVSWSTNLETLGEISATGFYSSMPGITGDDLVFGQFQTLTDSGRIRIRSTLPDDMDFVDIPGGSFLMGDNNGPLNQQPAHQVFVDEFKISRYEITNTQYAGFLQTAVNDGDIKIEFGLITGLKGRFANLIYGSLSGTVQFPQVFIAIHALAGIYLPVSGFENYPVVRLTWAGASAFCEFYGYRLPTEAEWEKAARGGSQLVFATEDGTIDHDLVNYSGVEGHDTFFGPGPVGSFPSNPFGLFDMSGNVAEYVFDLYDPDYYMNSRANNPIGPGPDRPIRFLSEVMIWRGGSWLDNPDSCRTTFRGSVDVQADVAEFITAVGGLRVVRDLP